MSFRFSVLKIVLIFSLAVPFHANAVLLEEVIVTAQKRDQDLQDVGIAITAFTGDQLRSLGLTSTEQLDNLTPGLLITDFGNPTTTVFTLRGSAQLDFADHQEPPVAVYLDGAYNSWIGGVGMQMFDLERVEVLKGPQGTLFGRNATGGVVHLITAKPTDTFEGYGEVSIGEFSKSRFEGAISGPMAENLNGRASVLINRNDGIIENFSGSDLNETDSWNGRVQFEWTPNDQTTINLQGRYSRDRETSTLGYQIRPTAINRPDLSGADLFARSFGITETVLGIPNDPTVIIPGSGAGDGLIREVANATDRFNSCFHPFDGPLFFDFTTPPPANSDCFNTIDPDGDFAVNGVDQEGEFDRTYKGITGTINLELDNGMEIVSITDYQKLDKFYLEDTDGTAGVGFPGFVLFDFFQFVDSWQFSEEFRLHGETESLKWVVGAYYLRIEGDFRSGIDIRGSNGTLFDNRYSNETESYAFFGQGEYAINDQFSFTAGIRWTQDKKTMINNPSCDSTVADIALTGGGGIPTDCTFVPLTFPILLPGVTVQELGFNGSQSEGDYALKLGLDWRPNEDWLVYASATRGNKAGAFNGGAVALYTPAQAAFGSEVLWAYETGFKATLWGGKAIFNSTAFYYDYNDFQTFTQLGPSLTVFNIDAEVLGAEFELIANPFEGLEFSFGVSLLDAEVKDLAYGDGGGPTAPPAFIQNAPMTNSPDLTLNGLARYEWPMLQGKMALQMDFNWVDDRNLNAVPHPSLRAEDYVLINARLTYTWGQNDNWYMALWVENLTDEYYVPTAFDLTGFTGSTIDIPGRPRWIGGTIGMSWE